MACGEFGGLTCIDSDAACFGDDGITVEMLALCKVLQIGDGQCDNYNNKMECGYDGGDCCSCTCQPSLLFPKESCSAMRFDCQDPTAPCFAEKSIHLDVGDEDDDKPVRPKPVPWEETQPLPMVPDAVEVGAKTKVGVSATTYNVRLGKSRREVGCGEAGGTASWRC
ncbi:unnamed protein product [Ectocarpus fasciculatus]